MEIQLFNKYKNLMGYVNYVLCLFLLFFVSAPDSKLRFLFNAWLISWALEFRWLDVNNFTFRKYNKSILMIVGFVAIGAVSLLWSSNVDNGLHRLYRHLYYVAIAFVSLFGVNERYKLKTMLYVYIVGAVIVGCCYFVVMYYVYNKEALFDYSQNTAFVMPSINDMAMIIHQNKLHQNLGLGLTLALVAIPFVRRSLVKDLGRLNAYVLISFSSLIILLCIYFSGCRSSLLMLFVCLFVGVLFRMRTKGRIWALCITAVLSLSLVLLLKHHPRSKNVSFELSKCITGNFEGNEEPRILIWHGVYSICGENFFFGSGLGSSRDRLSEFYMEHNYPEYFSKNKLSSHSQYFEVLLEMGIFSMLLLCVLLVLFPWFFEYKARILASFIMTMYGIQGLTDAMMFGGCTGIMILCIAILFCVMLANEQIVPNKE